MRKLAYLFTCLVLFIMSMLTSSCGSGSSNEIPSAVITKKIMFSDMPSASGIERVGNNYYVIGDDSPYLFRLDKEFKIISKTPLLDSAELTQGRIPKDIKADLEAITALIIEGQPYLLILGSGASNLRNKAYLVPMTHRGPGKPHIIDFQPVYEALRKDKDVVGSSGLNIEAVATDSEYLYLLHRYSPNGKNVLISFPLNTFIPFLMGDTPPPAPAYIHPWKLPKLRGIQTGFSGAAPLLGGRLLFTASAEDSPNTILDGEIFGSIIGILNLPNTAKGKYDEKEAVVIPVKEENGKLYTGKLESICILEEHSHSQTVKALAVSDYDDGRSEVLVLQIKL